MHCRVVLSVLLVRCLELYPAVKSKEKEKQEEEEEVEPNEEDRQKLWV